MQLPTTLPTLDELIGLDGVDERNVDRALLATTVDDDENHVFTLHAELEGGQLAAVFTALLSGWLAQGHTLGTLAASHAALRRDDLPLAAPGWGQVKGRSGELLVS